MSGIISCHKEFIEAMVAFQRADAFGEGTTKSQAALSRLIYQLGILLHPTAKGLVKMELSSIRTYVNSAFSDNKEKP